MNWNVDFLEIAVFYFVKECNDKFFIAFLNNFFELIEIDFHSIFLKSLHAIQC